MNQEIMEQLMQHTIKSDETFKFHCTKCGRCCCNRSDIMLSPFDLYRMAQGLGISIQEVVNNYGFIIIGETSKIPLVILKMKKNGNCPLMKHAKCSIQNNKPSACALFPLGRCISRDNNKPEEYELKYFLQDVDCGLRDEEHTPEEWVSNIGLKESEEQFLAWKDVGFDLSQMMMELCKTNMSEALLQQIYQPLVHILYMNYDMKKDIIPQVQDNISKAKELIGSILELINKVTND